MKTRIIATALFTYFAFTASPLMSNNVDRSVSGLSNSENPVSAPLQVMSEVQTTFDTAQHDDWFAGRASWEQTGENSATESIQVNTSFLEEWVSGLENWEQEKGITKNEPAQSGSVTLDQWITGIEIWEQE